MVVVTLDSLWGRTGGVLSNWCLNVTDTSHLDERFLSNSQIAGWGGGYELLTKGRGYESLTIDEDGLKSYGKKEGTEHESTSYFKKRV